MKPGLMSLAVLTGAAVLMGACGTAAPGAGTAFCAHASTISAGIYASGSSAEVSYLRANESEIDELEVEAPAAVRGAVRSFVTGVHRAIAANDATLANTSEVDRASGEVKTYCGIRR
jgi:hypothetical protein